MTPTDRTSATARILLLVAALVVVAEAVSVLVLAALDVRDLDSERLASGIGTGLFLAVLGVGLLVAVVQLLRGRAWARGPLVVVNIIAVLLAWNLRGDDTSGIAVLLAVGGGVALAALLSPPVTRALGGDDPV